MHGFKNGTTRVAMILGLALVNLLAAGYGFSYAIPGGIRLQSYIPVMFSAFSVVVCACGLRASSVSERIARLVCVAVAIYVTLVFIVSYQEYQVAVHNAYHR